MSQRINDFGPLVGGESLDGRSLQLLDVNSNAFARVVCESTTLMCLPWPIKCWKLQSLTSNDVIESL